MFHYLQAVRIFCCAALASPALLIIFQIPNGNEVYEFLETVKTISATPPLSSIAMWFLLSLQYNNNCILILVQNELRCCIHLYCLFQVVFMKRNLALVQSGLGIIQKRNSILIIMILVWFWVKISMAPYSLILLVPGGICE